MVHLGFVDASGTEHKPLLGAAGPVVVLEDVRVNAQLVESDAESVGDRGSAWRNQAGVLRTHSGLKRPVRGKM